MKIIAVRKGRTADHEGSGPKNLQKKGKGKSCSGGGHEEQSTAGQRLKKETTTQRPTPNINR